MNGWYVEVLLLNRERIRSDIFSRENKIENLKFYIDDNIYLSFLVNKIIDLNINNDFEFVSSFGDDLHSDLLDVERTYNELYLKKIITKDEIMSLNSILSGNYLKENRGTRQTTIKNFSSLCSKIAYKLGSYFTNDGYIEYLRNKYNLTLNQVNKIYQYIGSKYRLREIN